MTSIYANKLYPAEVIQIMVDVLAGQYHGSNPEQHIDGLLGAFSEKIVDKRKWASEIAGAVKALDCLDCVQARLNLECLLEECVEDIVTIFRGRNELLVGERGGSNWVSQQRPLLEFTGKLGELVERGDSDDPYAGHDRVVYSDGLVVSSSMPRPSLSRERKAEVLALMEASGHETTRVREEAWERLEKLLRVKTPEQSLIGRLAYLIVFEAFRMSDLRPSEAAADVLRVFVRRGEIGYRGNC